MKHLASGVISQQSEAIYALLSKHVARGSEYALVDFPSYSNVGDSLIWLGLRKALKDITGRYASWVCHRREVDFSGLHDLAVDAPIFLCGGGSFGDIWKEHQDFRYRLLDAFPDRPIIQMPQSIKFNEAENSEACARKIAEQGNFQFYVRDQKSFEVARDVLHCIPTLAPDTAFCLGQLQTDELPNQRMHETLYMLREDVEAKAVDLSEVQRLRPGPVFDWLKEPADTSNRRASTIISALKNGRFTKAAVKEQHYAHIAQRRLQRGRDLLSSGHRIVTDRLHVHILSTLMNIPHIALDNSYGKIHGYIDAWTKSTPLVAKASNGEEVLDQMVRLPFHLQGEWKRNVNGDFVSL